MAIPSLPSQHGPSSVSPNGISYPGSNLKGPGFMYDEPTASDEGVQKLGRSPGHRNGLPLPKISKVACIGAGHVGAPSSAVIAYMHEDLDVHVVDIDAKRIAAWNSNSLPVYEPGLYDLVRTCRDGETAYPPLCDEFGHSESRESDSATTNGVNGVTKQRLAGSRRRRPNLFFSTEVCKAVEGADLIFISVDTPTKSCGAGAGSASDLSMVEAAARSIALHATKDSIVVEKSTVPCRTAELLKQILEANSRPGIQFEVISNPEFLATGTAIRDLFQPSRVLIGSLRTAAGLRAAATLADIYGKWVPRSRIITMNVWSSELSKLAANALLAQRISSVNALSAICEKTGADVEEVAQACGLDTRIGDRMLQTGPGFGGSCFRKDVLSLVYMSESLDLPEVAAYWRSIVLINEYQKDRLAKHIIARLFDAGIITTKKVAILGFAYKEGTRDARESAAADIVLKLAAEKVQVAIYDPVVCEEQIWKELANREKDVQLLESVICVCRSAYEACEQAHAVAVLTEWEFFSNKGDDLEFPYGTSAATRHHRMFFETPFGIPRNERHEISGQLQDPITGRLDWRRIAQEMRQPRYVFDGRRVLDAGKLEKLGFNVEAVGKASETLIMK